MSKINWNKINWNKGLESIISFGSYKGCRLGFLIKNHPYYIERLVIRKLIILDKEAKEKLKERLQEIYWEQYKTN